MREIKFLQEINGNFMKKSCIEGATNGLAIDVPTHGADSLSMPKHLRKALR